MNQNLENKKNLFSVPEGYFDSFPDKVLKRIKEMPEQKTKTPVRIIFNRRLAFAAAFIGFFLIFYMFMMLLNIKTNNNDQNVTEVYDEILLKYVNEDDLIDALYYENKVQQLSDKQIVDYLINDDINESILSNYINQMNYENI